MNEAQSIRHIQKLVREILAKRDRARKADSARKVSVGWPVYDEKEVMGALEALLELRISQGPRVQKFEELFAKYIGKKHAVAVNSGSSANLLALTALIQSGKLKVGDEVLLPATTFATVASPILQVGLIPAYVDVDPVSWNIDPREIEKAITKKTKAIMAVHTFGNPADMPKIMAIARKHKLIVIEDCCEAHGAMIGKKKVGSFGDLATLSFFVAHNITTGEGGMIFTNDSGLDHTLRSLREFGRVTKPTPRFGYKDNNLGNYDVRYVFTRLGYNVRMTDIEAALGLAQLAKLDKLNRHRLQIVGQYQKAFAAYEKYLQLPTIRKNTFHSFYGYPFVIQSGTPFSRMELAQFLESNGIETRPFFGGDLTKQPGFRDEPMRIVGKLPVATHLKEQGLFIGCHPELSSSQVAHVLHTFRQFFEKYDK